MNYGCKNSLPHDMKVLHENSKAKWEVCMICNRKFKWNKDSKGRIDNVRYLKAHARAFAQRSGATKRLYKKLYQPEECIIKI